MSLAASFVATSVYYESLGEVEDAVMDESVAWTIVGGLSGLGISFFACFLLLMKPGYKGSFISTQTGHAWILKRFADGETDELKSWVLTTNRKLWLPIRDDVKAWTLENWERWEEEKPEWFDDNFRAVVNDDWIPVDSLRRLDGGGGIRRRRSSLGDILGIGGKIAPVGGGGGGATGA
jgi:hypothetical protein